MLTGQYGSRSFRQDTPGKIPRDPPAERLAFRQPMGTLCLFTDFLVLLWQCQDELAEEFHILV
jgi:hypothetical protein